MAFDTLENLAATVFEGLRPSEHLSVTEAAMRYVMIRQPGAHVGHWSPEKTPYNVEIQDTYTSLDYTGVIDVGPARTGKALALDTPIATPTGWTTMGEIKVGEQVFDENGNPCSVTWVSPTWTDRSCYSLTFDDGAVLIADAAHEWAVEDLLLKTNRVLTTAEMTDGSAVFKPLAGRSRRFRIPVAAPLALRQTDLPLDPYFLGIWLGDGSSHRSQICFNRREGDHIAPRITEVSGYRVVRSKVSGGAFADRGLVQRTDGVKTIAQDLRDLDLLLPHGSKHIPLAYLRGSEHQRRELLRGLMDSDGMVGRGTNSALLNTTSRRLSDDLFDLLAGLGYKPAQKEYPNPNPKTGITYRISFGFDSAADVFSLPCKIAKASRGQRRLKQIQNRSVVEVARVQSVPVRCIEVNSPSHLYLAGRQMVPTHNSQKLLNWLAHTVMVDPTDMMLCHMAQHTAREWSKDDLEKFHRHSHEIAAKLKPGRQNDNTFDKEYVHGMRLEITWPTVKNLSGKTRRYVWLMDYDRMPDSIEGEGNAFDLGRKRTTTFKRFGMTVAESSPGREVENPKWIARTPHEAPPTKGILELYNRGDRRRWYWECPCCHEAFEPSFKLFQWPKCDDPMESAEQVTLICPNNGCVLTPPMKEEMNLGGRWVKDGMVWRPESGDIVERPGMKAARSDIASFWLKGPAAGFQTWQSIVLENIRAEAAYEATGDEEPLRKTVNTDQGDPYTPKSRISERLPEDLKAKAEDWGDGRDQGRPADPVVPEGVRFLVATIDVQARAFVVQVHGFAADGDLVVVDAFKVRKSLRLDGASDPLPLDPGAYPEDWDLLVEEVLLKSYPLADGSGRRMSIKATGCDSGGREGVTHQAYNFWRRLKEAREGCGLPVGLHRRFLLVKGDGAANAPRTAVSWPDSNRRDKMATARGDVPVVRLNVNLLKDQVASMLDRRVAEEAAETGGMIRFPAWLPDWFYTQVTTEIRSPDKGWSNPMSRRNESWDLLVYCLGLGLRPDDVATRAPLAVIRYDRIDWFGDACPGWAAEWDRNDLVFGATGARLVSKAPGLSFADLGRKLT